MACSLFVLDSNLGSIAYQIDGFGKAHVISKGLNLLRLKPRLSIVPASKGWHEKYTRQGIIPIILDLAHGECLINENTNEKNTKSNPRSQMHSENWFGLKSFLRMPGLWNTRSHLIFATTQWDKYFFRFKTENTRPRMVTLPTESHAANRSWIYYRELRQPSLVQRQRD